MALIKKLRKAVRYLSVSVIIPFTFWLNISTSCLYQFPLYSVIVLFLTGFLFLKQKWWEVLECKLN